MTRADDAGPTSRTYYSQRLRLHYVDWGNHGAPPLLLVHGGRDHCRNWDWVARRLRKDWHVIAPDLRGHGDSEWSKSANYSMAGYVYDLAQLVHQLKLAPVTIVGHSLGGAITVRYAGIYPENVKRLVAIEGLGRSPKSQAEVASKTMVEKMRTWIESQREAAGRQPRRYKSVEEAFARMQEQNKHLSAEQARHLTEHGIAQNEDGTFTWKFDNFVRVWLPYDMPQADIEALWANTTSPALMVYGKESWASDPRTDGRARHFKQAQFVQIAGAGHWVHHDKLETFMALVEPFLKGEPLPNGLPDVS
ncbi:MAG: alpha/beta hydrolase [Proteobacteria bacterium]|nr:alpha/beta hydrolase [Pseudomonadota bacterium]